MGNVEMRSGEVEGVGMMMGDVEEWVWGEEKVGLLWWVERGRVEE